MKTQEQKKTKGARHGLRTALHFMWLLVRKGFQQKPKHELKKTAGEARKKHEGLIVHLCKMAYRFVKGGGVQKQFKEAKEPFMKKKGTPRQRKTWARVKQDFQEYYEDLKQEFENKDAEGEATADPELTKKALKHPKEQQAAQEIS